jgi:hypothetical protein
MGKARIGFAALALLALAPAAAESALDRDAFKTFGGTYMSDCKNPASPRLTVFEDQVVLLRGDVRVAAGNIQNAASYFGNSPPEGYNTAILSEDAAGNQLLFVVYEDAAGQYISIDGDAKSLARVGKAAQRLKYRRCDAGPKRVSRELPPATAPVEGDAGSMILDKTFKAAHLKALGKLAREPWLAELSGPSVPTRKVTVAGGEYVLVSACKSHDCAESNTTLLYSPSKRVVYGKVRMDGRSQLYGAPPPAVAKELGEYWRKEWAQTN